MFVRKIKIYNLNSLQGEFEIDFTQDPFDNVGLFAITGDTGSGKTTILDAVTLAMFGRIPRYKSPTQIMAHGTGECRAEVEFEVKNNIYRSSWSVHRARFKPEGDLQTPKYEVAKWDVKDNDFKILTQKSRQTEKKIEEITSLNYQRFTKAVLLAQGDFTAFLKADKDAKGEILEQITGTEIYSKISIFCYEKWKKEKSALEKINFQLDAMDLLSKDEIKEKEIELEILSNNQNALRDKLVGLRAEYQLLIEIGEKEKFLFEVEKKMLECGVAYNLKKNDFKKLELHEQLLPFQADYQEIYSTIKLIEEGKEIIGQQKEIQNQNVHEVTSLGNQLDVLIKNEKSAKLEYETLEPKLEKAKKYEIEISHLKSNLESVKLLLRRKKSALVTEKSDLVKFQEKLMVLKGKEQENKIFLEENKHFKDFEQDRKLAEKIKSDYSQSIKDLKKIEVERTTFLVTLDSKRNMFYEQKQKIEQQKELLNDTKYSFADASELGNYKFDVNEKRNQINQQENLTIQLKSIFDQFTQNQANLTTQKLEKKKKIKLEVHAGNKVREWKVEMMKLEEKVKDKRLILDQQLVIESYQEARNKLKEGEECPLCFSTTHQLNVHEEKGDHQSAKTGLELAKVELDNLNKKLHLEVTNQLVLQSTIKQYTANINILEQKINEQKEQLLSILNSLNMSALPDALSNDLLDENIANFKKEMNKLAEELSYLGEMDLAYKQMDQDLKLLQQLETELVKLDAQNENFEVLIRQKKMDVDKSVASGKRIAEKYKVNKIDVKWKEMGEKYLDRKMQNQSYENAKPVLETNIRSILKKMEELKADINKANNDEIKFYENIQDKSDVIFDVIGNASVQSLKTEWSGKLEKYGKDIEILKNRLQKVKEIEQKAITIIEEQEKSIARNKVTLEKVIPAFESSIYVFGIKDWKDFQTHLLTNQEKNNIVQIQKELEQTKNELKLKIDFTKETISSKINMLALDINIQDCKLQLDDIEPKYDQLGQEIGGIKNILRHYDEQIIKTKSLVESKEEKEEEFKKWAALNDMIGSATGSKFKQFAQSLTLTRLLDYANIHLQKLNERYILSQIEQEELMLEIIDLHQANNHRKVETLSGGELFIASLALALGLSDMSSGNVEIKSLFIDEGFGNLDAKYLDETLTVLENLQSQGKLIGVISHVPAVKTRITTQIQVTKKSEGVSILSISG